MEGSNGTPDGRKFSSSLAVGAACLTYSSDAMTMSQYLGRGATSRGRTTITDDLDMVVSTLPYLRDDEDVQAVIQGIKNLQEALGTVSNLTWTYPPPDQSVEDFVSSMVVAYANRRANHWIGRSRGLGEHAFPARALTPCRKR